MCSAYSHELSRYGVKVGLTNYAAAYCTGLLCARRLLESVGMGKMYAGKVEADGEMFLVEEEERRPFKAFLDVGLHRTTTGARIFAAMKGAVDGGLFVPHKDKRFVGFAEEKLDASVLRKYIFGGHVADYMKAVKEDDAEKYKRIFSQYVAAGIEADDLERIYKKAHEAIRANPKAVKAAPNTTFIPKAKKARMNLKQRKDRVKQIIAARGSA